MRYAHFATAACLCVTALAFTPVLAAETDKPSYCVSDQADFYPYVDGQVCRKGYQIAAGNCRLKDARVLAVSKAECARLAGDVVLPLPAARLTGDGDPRQPAVAKPLTVNTPKN